jgi:hypothetical protein
VRARLLIAAALGLALAATDAAAARIRLQVEPSGGPAFYVYLARPVGLAASRPVVIAMPDAGADAKAQLDDWYPLAEAHRFLAAVPELEGPAATSPAALDAIFEAVVGRFGMTAQRFAVYGHAAGARQVQQWLLLQPQPHVARVVLAAAEGYIVPDLEVPPPQGLAGTAVAPEQLRRFLQVPLTVLIGEKESAPDARGLRLTAVFTDPGPQRLAEAQAFVDAGRAAAALADVPSNWRLVTVPMAGQSSRDLACAAIPYLLGEL